MASHPNPFQSLPFLTLDLRLVLSVLYNLPGNVTSVNIRRPTSTDAHDYLLQFQSRNARRRLQSQPNNQVSSLLSSKDIGSTWLACLYLVSSFSCEKKTTNRQQPHVQYAEALFAAQTMVHRLRRVKISEAIDLEFEPVGDANSSQFLQGMVGFSFPPSPQEVLNGYRVFVSQILVLDVSNDLKRWLYEYQPATNQMQSTCDIEERIKGEISMVLLATIVDSLEKLYHQQQQHPSVAGYPFRPLLSTLSSAMTVIAARIRYMPVYMPDPVPQSQPIVKMILSCLSIVQSWNKNTESFTDLYYICFMAVPDSILEQVDGGGGGSGGAFGRLSIDQRCYGAIQSEMKTQGLVHVCQAIQEIERSVNHKSSPAAASLLLQMLEAWARHVPLPNEFVEQTLPLILKAWNVDSLQFCGTHPLTTSEAKAAMGYWIATMESGSLAVDQILLSSLVQSGKGSNQPQKKKQSSKSKRRETQILETRTTNDLLEMAKGETRQRGYVACRLAHATWPAFSKLLRLELAQTTAAWLENESLGDAVDHSVEVEGGGPIGAVSACATACLPFMLREPSMADLELFLWISQAIQNVCESPSRVVRSFAAESLFSLHLTLTGCLASSTLLDTNEGLLEVLVQHFFRCSRSLATMCGYPSGYFADLERNNDDDLEAERNDVRDLLRTVAGIPLSSPKGSSSLPFTVSMSVLLNLLEECNVPIVQASATGSLFPETALHTFSALAKPINASAAFYNTNGICPNECKEKLERVLKLALQIAFEAGRCINDRFGDSQANHLLLPISRVYNLALASLSPMLSSLVELPLFEHEIVRLLRVSIEAAGTSLQRLPELTGPSTLRSTRFDIRGAMRSPGGEDHAGVLTLLRFAYESKSLAQAFLRSSDSILFDLCRLYQELKNMELQRGPGVFHGLGVLPKSRRILMGIICHLEITSEGEAGVSGDLSAVFHTSLSAISDLSNSNTLDCFSAGTLSKLCEDTFDMAAFGPTFTRTLFEKNGNSELERVRCTQVWCEFGNMGFKVWNGDCVTQDTIVQWNRLRAALFTLVKDLPSPDLPVTAVPLLTSWIQTECDAVMRQCRLGPSSGSKIFINEIISEETVPAGLFLKVVGNALLRALSWQVPFVSGCLNLMAVMKNSRQHVIGAITSTCGCPIAKGTFHDPRPVIAETWLECMNTLAMASAAQGLHKPEIVGEEFAFLVTELLVETFVASATLLLYCSLEKTQDLRSNDPGMTLDGPQGLMMMDFLESFFKTGSWMVQNAARNLMLKVPVDQQVAGSDADASVMIGIAIIGAVLYRGAQGCLPPWAVESIPAVYFALFTALEHSIDHFLLMLEMSMVVRLAENQYFGSVQSGSLLSGRCFEKMSDRAKIEFLDRAREIAQSDPAATSWKRFKSLIKQVCGGKKKDTDFNQRPGLTRFDTLDRI